MTIRDYLSRWLDGRKATQPIEFYQSYTKDFGPGIGNQPAHDTLLQESLGVADMATRAIANRISTLNPLVKTSRRVQDGTIIEDILDDHPLKLLLDRPHPNLTRSQLFRLTAQWIVTVGEAYWLKVGTQIPTPVELHPIPPTRIVPNVDQGVVIGYTVTTGRGDKKPLDADEVIRFFFPDPENFWASEGYLGPAGITADSLKFTGQHLRNHYKDDATPKTVMKALEGADSFSDSEKERFWLEWQKHYHARSGNRRGVPAMLPVNYDLITIAAQNGADVVPLLAHWRDEQLMGFGVPRSILGQVVSGDRSSAETNQYVFDRHTALPIAKLIADGLTMQLAPDFDTSLIVEFEQFVSDDKRFELEQETADLSGKVRSINQVREDRGLDPVEWGEEPVGKIGEMPYDPVSLFGFESDNPAAIEDEEPVEDEGEDERNSNRLSTRLAYVSNREGGARVAYFAPAVEWQRQLAREKAYVPSFQKAFMKVLGVQERDAIKKLRALMPRARVSAEELFSPEQWVDLFERTTEPIRRKAYEATLAESLGGFGISEFVMTEQMQMVLRHQGALMVKHTGRTTKSLIRRQLEQAIEEGEGVDQIAKRIKSVFRLRRGQHAPTIARTEVLKASQEAQLQSFELADVDKKQWNASRDDAVRASHASADGDVRARGEPFDLDGELALAPGIGVAGNQLSAGNSINCRCFLTPVTEE